MSPAMSHTSREEFLGVLYAKLETLRVCNRYSGPISNGWREFQEDEIREVLAREEMTKYWMVGIGGFLGSIARFWLGAYVTYRMGARFPYGTFVINISGSFLIGLIVTILAERSHWSPNWLYLIPIGFIGAYTTFSTFELEAFRSIRAGDLLLALLYVTLSVAVGFIAVWLGVAAGRTFE
jgi:CrcB protein